MPEKKEAPIRSIEEFDDALDALGIPEGKYERDEPWTIMGIVPMSGPPPKDSAPA